MYENLFCLVWKSHGVGFKKTIEELKLNFKVVDDCISDKQIEMFVKYEYKP